MSHTRRLSGTGGAVLLATVLSTVATLIAPAIGQTAPLATEPVGATGSVYYVDAEGSDAGDGLSPETAWRSLEKVSATAFSPGDRVLLQAGDAWTGQLWPKGSGTDEAPIEIGRYGVGLKPIIRGEGKVPDTVRLFNQSHWVISDLDISNERTGGATAADNLADLRGIHVSGDNSTTLSGFVIDGVDVHDVTGEVNWISGSVENNKPGIHFKTGWDGSKKTGGIVFDTTVPDPMNPPTAPTILDDVLVQNSTVINTSFAGITVKQYTGDGRDAQGNLIATGTGWGTRTSATDPKFMPHTNVTLRGNYIRQDGSEYGCNGIYLTNVRGALVERNTIQRAGTVGIETYFADDVTIQHNEVFDTQQKAGGADHSGIDPDKGTTKQLIQYNYIHGNGDGILICQFSFGDSIIRNNIIAENDRHPIYLHSDRSASSQIYNNTIYNTISSQLIYGYGSSLDARYSITNNVIHSTVPNATLTTSPTISYRNNLYSGAALQVPADDVQALVGDARFAAPDVSGPYGTPSTGPQLDTARAYALQSGSKAVNRAIEVASASPVDYTGTAPAGIRDLGALEYTSPIDAVSESIAGFVSDANGRRIPDAAVTATVGGQTYSGATDATGWYHLSAVPFGEVAVTATRQGYEGTPSTVSVASGTSAIADLTLHSTSNVGTVHGTVLNVAGSPYAGAALEVRSGNTVVASTVSDATGAYRVEAPIGDGYTVTAAAADLRSASAVNITVDPGAEVAVPALLLQPAEPSAIFTDDMTARNPGPLTSVDGYTVSQAGGSVAIVDVAEQRTAKLTRTTSTGSTSVQRNYAQPLTGLVTVETKVMRNDPSGSGGNWFSAPYIYGSDGKIAMSVGFSKGKIIAYQGTQSTELQPYELGRWYTIMLQVDTVNQRFSLLIDGKQVFTNVGFRNPLTGGIARIEWYANSSNTGSLHFDDIRILQGTERDRGDAGIAALTTDSGTPVRSGDTWTAAVPAGTDSLRVTVTPAASTAGGITVGGASVQPDTPSQPLPLAEGKNTIPIVVTAENGTQRGYTLVVERGLLAADATLSALAVDSGSLSPAFNPDVEDYTLELPEGSRSLTVTPTATAPQSEIAVDGAVVVSGSPLTVPVVNGQQTRVSVSSADGTAGVTYSITVTVPEPPVTDPAPPARGVLSNTSGRDTGLHDGNFEVAMNLWWGTNARSFRLFENGTLIATVQLQPDGLKAQTASVAVRQRVNGTYVYSGELVNTAGVTATSSTKVEVTQATPGQPTVRLEGSGTGRTLFTDLWWGTNATSYRIYDNGALVAEGSLTASSPNAQHVVTPLLLSPGEHVLTAVFANHAGETASKPAKVAVK